MVPKDAGTVYKRAYLITMGANAYENRGWDLHFAASDAKTVQEALAKRLAGVRGSAGDDDLRLPDTRMSGGWRPAGGGGGRGEGGIECGAGGGGGGRGGGGVEEERARRE